MAEGTGDVFANTVNDAYRAIGRYFYEFSRLVFYLRFGLRGLVRQQAVDLLLGSNAKDIADSYFAACREFSQLTDDEKRVLAEIRKRVDACITFRNDLAHGEWFIGWAEEGSGLPDDPLLIRIKPSRAAGHFDARTQTVEDLDQKSDDLVVLRARVLELGWHCLPGGPTVSGRLGDYLRLENDVITRSGPAVGQSTISAP